MCASLLSKMWSVRIHGNDMSIGNYPVGEWERGEGREGRGRGEGREGM